MGAPGTFPLVSRQLQVKVSCHCWTASPAQGQSATGGSALSGRAWTSTVTDRRTWQEGSGIHSAAVSKFQHPTCGQPTHHNTSNLLRSGIAMRARQMSYGVCLPTPLQESDSNSHVWWSQEEAKKIDVIVCSALQSHCENKKRKNEQKPSVETLQCYCCYSRFEVLLSKKTNSKLGFKQGRLWR